MQANATDLAGNPASEASQALTMDQTAPSIAVDTIARDETLDQAEASAGLTISDTTSGIEDGRTATITLLNGASANVGTYTATVTGNIWSASLSPAQAAALADGTYTVQANVADLAGNPALQGSQTLTVDQTAPITLRRHRLLGAHHGAPRR